MPLTRTVKIYLLIGLTWVVTFCFISCVPARWTKEDIHHLQMSAQRGDAKSQVLIGDIYEFGADVPVDPTIAAQWYQLAAKQDNPEAQFYLGVMYELGIGLHRNTTESLKWLFKAGEQGQERAQIWLAGIYLKDRELGQEFLKRIRKYRQSAERGNTVAQYTLGWIYREGAGLAVNPQEAMKWYRKAAQQGNTSAQFALGTIYLEGNVAPANPGEALLWLRKSAEAEIRAQAKLCDLYKGGGGVAENTEEAKKWSKTLAQNTDASLRSYIDARRAILESEKEKNPARAKRACERLSETDPAYRDVGNTCDALQKQIGEKMHPRSQEAASALVQKDWERFRNLLSPLLTPDSDKEQLRRLIASAWRLIEEETRAQEKIAQELLQSLETAERSAAYRKRNANQIFRIITAFNATVNQGLRDNPGDAALTALARKGRRTIASLQDKMRPSRPVKEKIEEKAAADLPEETQDDVDPGEDEYKKAQALFDNGRFEEAANFFEKTTKIRGSKYIAQAYIYLGISHLARINPANIRDARKLRLKGLACFQNALRFDDVIALPAGYDKYQTVFDEAKKRLQ
ncbi:MAG: sel1 repeat family protein [Deltaproteobacteria bacterium]